MEPEDLRELGPTYSSFGSASAANNAVHRTRGTNPCGRHFNTASAHPYNSRFDGPRSMNARPEHTEFGMQSASRNANGRHRKGAPTAGRSPTARPSRSPQGGHSPGSQAAKLREQPVVPPPKITHGITGRDSWLHTHARGNAHKNTPHSLTLQGTVHSAVRSSGRPGPLPIEAASGTRTQRTRTQRTLSLSHT